MIPRLTIQVPDENIEGQIDRLNLAVQHLMQGIELSAMTPRNPSQLSIVSHPEWIDEESEESLEFGMPQDLEYRLEEILLQLDRSQMANEDFWAETSRREKSPLGFNDEAYILKLEKENMELRSKHSVVRENYTLNLKKADHCDNEKLRFEAQLQQLDKLNENYQQKNQQILKKQESLRVKEKWLDQKEKEMRLQWQSFEKAKQEWEQSKNANKDQRVISQVPKILGKAPMYPVKIDVVVPEVPQTPSSRQKQLDLSQAELKELEAYLKDPHTTEETSKLIMKIDQLKNKIATLRGQKALFESNRASRLISNMMKTMEKEVNYEENKRKQQIERFTKKSGKPDEEVAKPLIAVNQEATRRLFSTECSTPRSSTSKSRQFEEKNTLNLKKENLIKREKELQLREQLLQETWMKVPGSKELIEIVNLTLSKLTTQKKELDEERENFESEKVELFKLRDKVMEQMNKIKN